MIYYYLPIALTIVSNVFYHICQKFIPDNVNPILSLVISLGMRSVVLLKHDGWVRSVYSIHAVHFALFFASKSNLLRNSGSLNETLQMFARSAYSFSNESITGEKF